MVIFSLVVMDYDEFSKDDFIGATRVNLYELLIAPTLSLTLRRLLDDHQVSYYSISITCKTLGASGPIPASGQKL